jgi:hypothetical protein
MRKDYRLYELNADEFENLVVRICVEWLGAGVAPFAPGRDGGRDGKFHGTASRFPSAALPLTGHCVLQAKHVNEPNKSCSDRDFERLLKKEHPKVTKLVKQGVCDHYLLFTNRKLTGGADQKLIEALLKLGLKSAHIMGNERLHLALDEFPNIRGNLPNANDSAPFRFEPDDLVEVIGALHAFAGSGMNSGFNSARDFTGIKIADTNDRLYNVRYDIRQISSALDHRDKFDLEAVDEIFEEAGIYFPEQLKRSYEDLVAFNKGVTHERNVALRGRLTVHYERSVFPLTEKFLRLVVPGDTPRNSTPICWPRGRWMVAAAISQIRLIM